MGNDLGHSGALKRPALSLRVSLIYAILGLCWVVGGDIMVRLGRPGLPTDVAETAKGTIYVILSALIIWLLVSRGEQRLRHGERRYRILVEAAQEGIWELDTDARTVFANQRMADMLGYAPQEMLGRSLFDFMDEAWAKLARKQFAQRMEGVSAQYELMFLRRDTTPLWTFVSASPLRDDAGIVVGAMGVLQDITAQRQERLSQDQFNEGLRQVVAIADEMIQLRDADAICKRTIELARERLGVERCSIFLVDGEDIRGTYGTGFDGQITDERGIRVPLDDDWRAVLRPYVPPGWEVLHGPLRMGVGEDAVTQGEGWIAVTPVNSREGPMGLLYNDTALSGAPLDPTRQHLLVVLASLLAGMIARTRAEAALARSEALYRQAITNARGVPYWRTTATTTNTFEFVGEGVEALTGIPADEFTPQSFEKQIMVREVVTPEGAEGPGSKAGTYLEGGIERFNADYRIITPAGEEKWISDSSVTLFDDQTGAVAAYLGILQDITERRRMEEALHRSHEYLSVALLAAKAGLWDWDMTTETLTWSPEFRALMGLPHDAEASFDTWLGVLHPDDAEAEIARLSAVIQQRVPPYSEYRILLPDGQERWIGAWGSTDYDEAGKPLRMAGICSDITDHKRAEDELRLREADLRRAQELAQVGSWSQELPAGEYTWSEQMYRIIGRDPAQGLPTDQEFDALIHPEDRAGWRRLVEEFATAGEGYEGELRIVRPDGDVRNILARAETERSPDGTPRRRWGTFQDITDRKRIEDALRESTQQFRSLYESMNDGVALYRMIRNSEGVPVDYEIVSANPRFCEIIGRTRDDVVGRSGIDVYKLAPPPRLEQYAQVVATGQAWRDEVYAQPLDRFLAITVLPWMQSGFAVMLSDITERRRAEWRRQLMAQVLSVLNRGVDEAAIAEMLELIAVQTKLQAVGLRAASGHDYPYVAARGFTDEFLALEASLCSLDDQGNPVLAEDGSVTLECICGCLLRGEFDPDLPIFTPNGSFWTNQTSQLVSATEQWGERWGRCVTAGHESIALIPVRSEGRPLGILHLADKRPGQLNPTLMQFYEELAASIGVALQRREDEQALRHARDGLELRVQERTEELQASHAEMEAFTYTVSHDLRAPLRAIQGFAEVLDEDFAHQLDEGARQCIQRIMNGAVRMDGLVHDLLSYSRLTRATLELSQVDTTELVLAVLEAMEDQVSEAGAVVSVQEGMPALLANETVLRQVVSNLLTNAIKFVAPGRLPRVEIAAQERGPWVRLWVSDNGIGIAPEHQDHIFGVFERLHSADTYPGTGIGLAIVQKGMIRMGGQSGVETAPGAGSRFWVELPNASA